VDNGSVLQLVKYNQPFFSSKLHLHKNIVSDFSLDVSCR
jgi:hypothetical protein